MKELLRNFVSLYHSHWREIAIVFFSVLIGLFADNIFGEIKITTSMEGKLTLIGFLFVSVIFLTIATYSLQLWRSTTRYITSIDEHTAKIANKIGQRIQIIPYTKGFIELEKRVQSAKSEIRALSNYVFDFEAKRHIYDPTTLQSPERKAAFQATQKKLQTENGNNFKFVKIVQLPKGHRLEEVLPYDPIYKEDCKFLANISRSEPEFASLRVSEIIFQNTFVVIDRSFLYLEFDTRKPETNQTFLPFVMIVEDPNSEVIQSLAKFHQRIEAGSTLITRIEDKLNS